MALLNVIRGEESKILSQPVSDGALLFATDTRKIYLDKGSERIEIASVQDLSDYVTNEELTEGLATKAPLSHNHTTAQVTGLDSALAGKAATGHTHAAATDAAAGFMSAADKEKLDGIAAEANKYILPTASSSTLGGVKTGANITNSSGTISLTKANVTAALGYTPPITDTNTWTAFKGATTSAAGTAGYVPAPTAGSANRYFRSDGTWTVPPDTNTNTTYTLTKSGSTISLTGSDGSKTSVTDSDTNTTYSAMTGATSGAAGKTGLVPAPAAGAATRYLRSDGTWQVPPDTNTTYTLSSFGITATAAELNKLDGCTATVTELNYLDGVTSSIQTQLNAKAPSSHTHSYLPLSGGTLTGTLTSRAITPSATNTYNIGTSSLKFANVYATKFVGALSGNATTATTATKANQLTTARTITASLSSSTAGSFNGTANITVGTTGTLPINKGGTGATTAAAARNNLAAAPSDIILVQSAQPTSSTCKLWIKI